MVCTRKKDYGELPPPKPPRTTSTQQDAAMIPSARAAAAVGNGKQDVPEKSKTHTNTLVPRRKFTYFPKLPSELRIMIWRESLKPRLVPVGPRGKTGDGLYPRRRKNMLPPLLSVNCESRHCALPRYTLKFTITITVNEIWNWHPGPPYPRTWYSTTSANVVMSPDDTLAFFGWHILKPEYEAKLQFASADGIGPWGQQLTIDKVLPQVKKVALLGWELVSTCDHSIIHPLNSMISWDVDSMLHQKSNGFRKLLHLLSTRPGYSKDKIAIHSSNYNGSFQEWIKKAMNEIDGRIAIQCSDYQNTIPDITWPDIVAFELEKRDGGIYDFSRTETWQYESFYEGRDGSWSSAPPNPRGL